MTKRISSLLLLLFFSLIGLSQEEYRFQLNNGLEVYLIQDTSMRNFEISLGIHGGQLWDRCNQIGLANVLTEIPLSANEMYPDPSLFEQVKNTRLPNLRSEVSPEYIRYYADAKELVGAVAMMEDIIRFPEFSQEALEMAVARANQLLARQSLENLISLPQRIWPEVFRENYCPYTIEPDSLLSSQDFNLDSIKLHYFEHVRPDRALLIIKGSVNRNEVELMLGDILQDWEINPAYNLVLRPKLYRSNKPIDHQQGIEFSLVNNPQYFIAFQGPSFNKDYGSVIPGLIFNHILGNLPSNAPDALKERKFRTWQYSLKYANLLALEWQPQKESLNEFLSNRAELLNALRNPSIVTEKGLEEAKKALQADYDLQKGKDIAGITNAWATSNILYYLSFGEILEQVNLDKIYAYQKNYISNSFPYELLVISSSDYFDLGLDTVFLPVNRSIADLKISFAENSPKISEDAYPDLIALKQFLENNPQYLVQINGFADKSEYLKVKDPVLDSLIASYPNFKRIDSKMINPKFTRLDMARSLYAIKYLLDEGILPERISGTSTLIKSKENEARYKNRKITISLDQIRSERYLRLINANQAN